jgi:hypothetical protein
MKLEIDCPECGYNSYLVEEILTKNKRTIVVSKCPDGGCDLSIDDVEHQHYEDFEELSSFFNSSFNIIEITARNCVN